MNIVFYILIALAMFTIWALLSAIFIPLGRAAYAQWKKINDKLNRDIQSDEGKENKDESR